MATRRIELTSCIDRIEGDIAVVELPSTYLNLPISELPPGVKEGHHLHWTLELDAVDMTIDEDATQIAKREVEEIRRRLSAHDDGGDIEL